MTRNLPLGWQNFHFFTYNAACLKIEKLESNQANQSTGFKKMSLAIRKFLKQAQTHWNKWNNLSPCFVLVSTCFKKMKSFQVLVERVFLLPFSSLSLPIPLPPFISLPPSLFPSYLCLFISPKACLSPRSPTLAVNSALFVPRAGVLRHSWEGLGLTFDYGMQ